MYTEESFVIWYLYVLFTWYANLPMLFALKSRSTTWMCLLLQIILSNLVQFWERNKKNRLSDSFIYRIAIFINSKMLIRNMKFNCWDSPLCVFVWVVLHRFNVAIVLFSNEFHCTLVLLLYSRTEQFCLFLSSWSLYVWIPWNVMCTVPHRFLVVFLMTPLTFSYDKSQCKRKEKICEKIGFPTKIIIILYYIYIIQVTLYNENLCVDYVYMYYTPEYSVMLQ